MSKKVINILCFACIYILGICQGILICIPSHKEPKAIDVYRGKTTLKITSIDGIPTDTIVVFKYN